MAVPTKPFPTTQNPLPLRTAGGFSLCPLLLLDIEPQSFLDDRRARPYAVRLLEPVNRLDQIAGKIDIHQNMTSRAPPLSMSDNSLRRGCG